MFYLSEIINKKILNLQGNRFARVLDLVAELVQTAQSEGDAASLEGPGENGKGPNEELETVEYDAPVIKGVLARTSRKGPPFFLPVELFNTLLPGEIRLASSKIDLQPFERRPGEILLTHDLWDKQVIDLKTRRVVRVNDIVISDAVAPPGLIEQAQGPVPTEIDTRWWVRGVDVGLGGLVRRLHIAGLLRNVAKEALQPNIVRWRHLDVFGSDMQGAVNLTHRKLSHLHPVEIARITDSVSYHQGAEIIASLDDALAADTLEELVAERQTDILEALPEERAADILDEMAPDEATDLLSELPEEKASSLLKQMGEQDAQEVRYLMRYPEHSAGGIMTTEFVRVFPHMTVGEVIDENRPIFLSADLIYYMYVLDAEEAQTLVGIITVRDLLVHARDDVVRDFMLTEFLSVRPGESKREVARRMAEYNLLALPVLGKNGTLLGVVTVDDALDALLPEGWQKRLPRIFG